MSIREKGTGKPVASVGIIFGSPELAELLPMAITDAEGRYEAIAPPGEQSNFSSQRSEGLPHAVTRLSRLSGRHSSGDRPRAMARTLPPIELDRGVTIRGVVVDEVRQASSRCQGRGQMDPLGEPFKAANGATGRLSRHLSATRHFRRRGQFVLEGINPGANVMLEASLGNARTDRPQPAAAGTAPRSSWSSAGRTRSP